MKRECDGFKELMLDLAYDEVDAELAEQLREHAAECASCREELQAILLTRKLAAQLPEPEPPLERDAEILDLAAEAAARHARSVSRDTRDPVPARGLTEVERPVPFIDKLRAWLLRPALVTAGVACMVFVISYFVGRNALEEDSLQRSAESGAPFVGPAVAVDAVDGRSPVPEPAQSAPSPREKRAEEPTSVAQRDLQPATDLGTGGKLKGAARGSLGTAGPPPQNSAAQFPSQPPALAAKAEAADDFDAEKSLDALPDYAGVAEGAAKSKAAPAAPAAQAPPQGAPAPQAEEAEAYAGDDAHYYQTGMAAYNRGDCHSATIALRKVVDPPHGAPGLVPSALHHVARCEKRTGRCGKALIAYDELLNRFPAYQGRAEAMWEAAGCHRRLGHVDRAWALLDALAKIPAWRDRARAEQQNLEQLKGQE